jgi:hypothetical protein
MVVAGKIFRLSDTFPLAEIASRLQGYHSDESYGEIDFNFTLVTEVVGLLPKGNMLKGVYSHDYVIQVFYRGKIVPTPRMVKLSSALLGKRIRRS